MKTLKVPDMHCQKCVERISNALSEEKIVFDVSLDQKIVTVEDGKLSEAIEALDDLGFDATE